MSGLRQAVKILLCKLECFAAVFQQMWFGPEVALDAKQDKER